MKTNKLTIILILIIVLLLGYIGYDKLLKRNIPIKDENNEKLEIVDTIKLDYLTCYLTSDGISYIKPINKEEIENIEGGNNLKQRLKTLYERSFYYDIFIDGYKLKGFKIELDSKITGIRKVMQNDNVYIIFLKENNTIGLFNYDDYNDLNNILDIKDNMITYLDGSKEEFKIEE